MPTRPIARRPAARGRRRPSPHAAMVSPHAGLNARPSLVFAGLGAVVLGVPLAVLPGATGPYDDPKAWALPILVGLAALAWLVNAPAEPGTARPPADRRARVLRWIVLVCASWWALTTAISVALPQSVLGSFGRGTGFLVIGSTALLFFLIQAEARTARSVRALVDVALLGSVPVCLVALGQAAGWDPLPKPWDPATAGLNVRSTLGSHIFLGTYLVVLIPLAAARIEWAYRERTESGGWPTPTRAQWLHLIAGGAWVAGAMTLIALASYRSILWWALVPWGVVAALVWTLDARRRPATTDTALTPVLVAALLVGQVLVVLLSRGRGAFIGMVIGLGTTFFAFLIRRRAWKTVTAGALVVSGLIAFLTLLNVPASPVAPLGRLPLLSRLSEITDVKYGSPGWVRLQVWKGIADGWRRQVRGEEMIPGTSPRLRSVVGYGPETQLLVLEPVTTPFLGELFARGDGWQARYIVDRSHNVMLDHLVTGGLVGAGLWLVLMGSLVAVGLGRIRTSATPEEITIRIGALGALLGHLADGQVGIATPTGLALFWLSAALLTPGPWVGPVVGPEGVSRRRMLGTPLWIAALIVAAFLTAVVAWAATRWLLASVAYADGTRHGIAGRLPEAYRDFRRSVALTWLSLPAEAAAYTALRLAGSETDPSRRLALLRDGQALLARTREYAMGGADSWALTGQLAFTEARAEGRNEFAASRDAFVVALRIRPNDAKLLAQWGWIWLESGDPVRGRDMARQALARDQREWLAWALLARASWAFGDATEAGDAASRARALAPPDARRLLDNVLP